MKIIQNFSSGSYIRKLPTVDILIWLVGLIRAKRLGHTLKLYCKQSDIDFLKQWKLYQFYDEIDTEFLSTFESKINQTDFWSIRKLECIRNEFEISSEPFVYMDTDVILNIPLSCPTDLLVWSPEPSGGVYLDWSRYSLPSGYELPDWLLKTSNAYNCGVLAFKSKELFNTYLNEYYKFTVDNPCRLNLVDGPKFIWSEEKAIWACTAEQRILKGIADFYDWDVTAVNLDEHETISTSGIHYYILRNCWRNLDNFFEQLSNKKRNVLINSLTLHVKELLNFLPDSLRQMFFDYNSLFRDVWESNKSLTKYNF